MHDVATGFAFGWVLSLAGIFGIITAMRQPAATRHWMDLTTGAVAILTGFFILLDPTWVLPAFAWAAILWFGASGIIALTAALKAGKERAVLAILGICELCIALFIVLGFPQLDFIGMGLVVSIILIASGFIRIGVSLRLWRLAHKRHAEEHGDPKADKHADHHGEAGLSPNGPAEEFS